MLTRLHRPPDETLTLPPISILTIPYAFTPLPLPSLRLCSPLLTCSRHCLPSLRSWNALPTCSQHHLSLRLRSALPTFSQHHLSLCFHITSIVYSGLLAYTMNAIAKIC
ncbi:hypothetical protein O181_120425 [Austropuccinia psidii MF-1]|uniref:Uncharacterized protein n=1 Tax=Austropuccinia psidii MF-1 TaxID=1389203 RepID=A0A9Q3KFR9_9BASI|nr:hypothetical protein [Austropuccinia psidii MF-1]